MPIAISSRFREYDREDILGSEIALLVHPDDVGLALARFRLCLEGRHFPSRPRCVRYERMATLDGLR
jgi:hypothetical protein